MSEENLLTLKRSTQLFSQFKSVSTLETIKIFLFHAWLTYVIKLISFKTNFTIFKNRSMGLGAFLHCTREIFRSCHAMTCIIIFRLKCIVSTGDMKNFPLP